MILQDTTLVFDLDGTLVDTAPDLVATLNHVFGEAGLPKLRAKHIRPFISFGARHMLMEGLRLVGETRNEAQLDAMLGTFLDHYSANVAVHSQPYPNVAEVLDTALQGGARLGVCTNKREDLSRALLRTLDLHDRFKAIVGRDTLGFCKPDPRHLTETIDRAGGQADRAIMIGDSATDVATAKAAGVPVVAVSFGYSEHPVQTLGADAVIDDFTDLLALLPGLLKR